MKYEIGKEYDHNAVKDWPVGTIFKSLWHGKLSEIWAVTETDQVTGVNIQDGSSMVDKDSVFLTSGLSFTYVPLEFGSKVCNHLVGSKIHKDDLHELPAGSILTYNDFIYIRVGEDHLYRLNGGDAPISNYGFEKKVLTIKYIGETS